MKNKPFIVALCMASLSGCATDRPTLAVGGIPPKTVIIEDIPEIKMLAIIGVRAVNAQRDVRFFFSDEVNPYFAVDQNVVEPARQDYIGMSNQVVSNAIVTTPTPMGAGTAGVAGALGGVIGAMAQSSAEATTKKAVEFPALANRALSNGSLKKDVISDLRRQLEARGIQVSIDESSRNQSPRLHWPASDASGKSLPVGKFAQAPSVDADILVQISPVASYAAPGPLNPYRKAVGIGLALFDGRTRKFLGWQSFPYESRSADVLYPSYESLTADIKNAAPGLRRALLEKLPAVVDAIAGAKTMSQAR